MDTISQHQEREQFSERELVILRLIADGLSNQEIADRLFLALTTVKWYIRQINDKLDTHSRTQTVARAHQLKLIGESDTVRVSAVEATEPPENPYKGLHAFREIDAKDFFGREALVEQLLSRLAGPPEQQRFLAVIGPSGSGKSSVVNAGLVPALRQGKLPGSERWQVATFFPGAYPLEELEAALLRIAVNPPESLINQLREDEHGLLRAVKRVLPSDERVELLLIIDQFEELFTLVEQEGVRVHLLDSLHMAINDPRSRLKVIVTLRADFVDRPLLYSASSKLIQQQHEFILPLSADELKQAIVAPARRVGVEVETDLVAEIVREVGQQPGTLPLLQYTLTELFEHREDGRLTLTAYRDRGGLRRALAQRADELHDRLNPEQQEAARQLFLRLVQLGEGTEDTRRPVLQAEVLSVGNDPASMNDILQTFAAYRLLTLDRDTVTGAPMVELAHEAIIREWGRLRAWLDENRVDVRFQRMLASSAREWLSSRHDLSFLLTGARLAQFEEWAGKTTLALTGDERAFLEAGLAERERQAQIEQERQAREKQLERRSRNVLRTLVVVLLLAALGGFSLAGVAVNQSQIAQRSEAEARSLALSSSAQLQLNEGNIEQAVALAQAALQVGDSELAQRVLDQAAFAPRAARIFQETGGFIPAALAPQETEFTFVMVATFGPPNPFGVTMIKGMEDACAFLNASCQWLSNPIQDTEPEQMVGHWEEALALNPDGIGTTIWDADLIRSSVEQAAEEGIPVVVFDIARALGDDRFLSALLYIGSDEYIGGQTNARRVFAEANADGVTIRRGVCTNQLMGTPPSDARCAGVASVFDQEGVPLDEIPISAHSLAYGAREIGAYFADHPETNAIFMLGPNTASALNLYFRVASLEPRQLYATTHDTSPEIFQMIRDGYLLQTIDRQPYMQGFLTIVSLYLYREYGLRPSGFINTASVIDRSNIDSVVQLGAAGYR